jgi:peroxiredoxin
VSKNNFFLSGWLLLSAVIVSAAFQSCSTSVRTAFVPPAIVLDTTGPHYLHNVSEVKYWDRISSANRATNFGWYDSTGKVHEMYEFYDKVVVLSFFGTWSPAAVNELATLDSARSSGDTNVLYLGVSMKEGVLNGKAVRRIDSFARSQNIPFQLLIGSPDFGYTYSGIDVVPTTFVITLKRKISATFEGYVSEAKLLNAISEAEKK